MASCPTIVAFAAWLAERPVRSADGAAARHDGRRRRRRRIRPCSALADRPHLHRSRCRAGLRTGRRADARSRRGARDALEPRARSSTRVRYDDGPARQDGRALTLAFRSFVREEWEQHTAARRRLAAYVARERWWLDDYALFLAFADVAADASTGGGGPTPLRAPRRAGRSTTAGGSSRARCLQHQYLPVDGRGPVAGRPRRGSRIAASRSSATCRSWPTADSADVWARADEFLSRRVRRRAARRLQRHRPGLGPAGLPLGRRPPARLSRGCGSGRRRMAALFDGFCASITSIGLYRTLRPASAGAPFFVPGRGTRPDRPGRGRPADARRGPGSASSPRTSAWCPTSCGPSLARLGLAWLQGLRWERDWHDARRALSRARRLSGAVGRHDRHARYRAAGAMVDRPSADDRAALLALPGIGRHPPRSAPSTGARPSGTPCSRWPMNPDRTRCSCRSRMSSAGVDRVNTPGTVGPRELDLGPALADRPPGRAARGGRRARASSGPSPGGRRAAEPGRSPTGRRNVFYTTSARARGRVEPR